MVSRTVVLAVDESELSLSAARWACANLVRTDDAVHLLGVVGPVSAGLSALPLVPGAETTVAVASVRLNYQERYAREEERCKEILVCAKKALAEAGRIETQAHELPATGGASGVAGSIVEWASKEHADVVVLGSRGMGAVRSTLMSLVGLGSVSAYCLHHLACPVCVVRGKGLEAPRKPVNKVLVPVDDSEAAQHALRWAIDNVVGPQDELHIVCVAFPVPYVIASEDAAAAHVLEAQENEEAVRDSRGCAREAAAEAASEAAKKVDRDRIRYKALEPEGGASDVGLSIKHYVEANGVDLVVMGSRGVGAVRRALLSLVGLGSVSDWCTHNLECPLIITKK